MGQITPEQAELSKTVPMSQDICLEADSGGHTDQGVASVLVPSIQSLRKELMKKYEYAEPLRIGLAGGIGTPEAAAAAFIMGADFILTGSINQCTVEAGISDSVKNLLQDINIQDTDYAPAGDMFEIGAKVQVLKKGVFFPARANKLYMLYSHYGSLEEIPVATKKQLEEKYFKKSLQAIWEEIQNDFIVKNRHDDLRKAEKNPKSKMALTFRWYFKHSSQITFIGNEEHRMDYQIHTGPALGAFNQWVKGSSLEDWRNRHVDKIAEKLMIETAQLITQKILSWTNVE
jgi:trans-AT polyketide synthase/acyltransferase/oxidoreductase domain-containing protein